MFVIFSYCLVCIVCFDNFQILYWADFGGQSTDWKTPNVTVEFAFILLLSWGDQSNDIIVLELNIVSYKC